ncbi:MAG: hypothetical protein H7A20_02365 [Rhodanobacteraceae bacterium]|nr:hypothetical protein [Rhodanobacteraceae bacterium]
MNLSTRLLVLATLVAVHLPSSAGEISGVDDIEQALRSSRFVNFYFVSRTEKYDYDRQEMEAHAGVAIKRSCGWNCASFMGPVLTHLRDSMKVECPAGQQGVLGETVQYQDACLGDHKANSWSGCLVSHGVPIRRKFETDERDGSDQYVDDRFEERGTKPQELAISAAE